MDISVIIVNYNVYNDVVKCIQSIYSFFKGINFEILVVDNNSSEKDILNINSIYKDVKLTALVENKGFGAANNVGMKNAVGNCFLLVNPDILFLDNSIAKMLDYLNNENKAGAAGPVQIKPGGKIEYYYTFFPSIYSRIMQEFGFYMKAPIMKHRFYKFLNDNINKAKPFKVDWVIGSCLLVKRKVYEEIGGFDEAFFLYEEETEWQYRMKKKGWDSIMYPEAKVIHNHSTSSSKIGKMFILYQEYRSRIIFSAKQFNFPLNLIRKFLTFSSIIFRFIYFTIFDYNSSEILKKRIYLYADLIKLTLKAKKQLLSTRFMFDGYRKYFLDTKNARF